MPPPSAITTINYTLSWPHLENPSNTTFAGPTQINICRCGPSNNTDLGHVYTRYRCPRPRIHFAAPPPDEELWVLQAPLGHVNLLRPANAEEIQRRKDLHDGNDPTAYAGKNFLLLSGPCPRGRYQALATLSFLKSLSLPARQNIECLSIIIQPYEEDCVDDAGGRAYVELARYILEELPGFKTLCLNIWGEETREGAREFAMVLWREGVKVVVGWDWRSGDREEFEDVEGFLRGVDGGVGKGRPVWEGEEGEDQVCNGIGGYLASALERSDSGDSEGLASPEQESTYIAWEDTSDDEDDEGEYSQHEIVEDGPEVQEPDDADGDIDLVSPLEQNTNDADSLEEGWSDSMVTPISPNSANDRESWHML